MKKTFILLPLLLFFVTSCKTNTYEQYFDNPNDWVIYYSSSSPDGDIIISDEPIAVMTLNESQSTYFFHDIDQEIFADSRYIPFSSEGGVGSFSYHLDDTSLGGLFSFECNALRELDESAIIGTFILKRDETLDSEEFETSETFGMHYQIQVNHLENGKVELRLLPFMPGMIQLSSWAINKQFC